MFRIFKFREFYTATSPGNICHMHEAISVKNTGHHSSIGQRQFICFVGDRLISIVKQLKLNKSLFFEKFREKTGRSTTPKLTDKSIGGTSRYRRATCCLRVNVRYVFP
jgi:hypothetical protein